jgi:hypothetical protein
MRSGAAEYWCGHKRDHGGCCRVVIILRSTAANANSPFPRPPEQVSGVTPLFMAVSNGATQCIELLREHGALMETDESSHKAEGALTDECACAVLASSDTLLTLACLASLLRDRSEHFVPDNRRSVAPNVHFKVIYAFERSTSTYNLVAVLLRQHCACNERPDRQGWC